MGGGFDFEIEARLLARKLTVHSLPDGRLELEGDARELDRRGTRATLPTKLEAGEAYDNVELEKRARARLRRSL
jgi:hypothetical protein